MAEKALSPTWYRVAELRPRLRTHVRVHRHEYRDERWYVVEDRISRRTHRFNPAAWYIIGLMNGERTMREIWDAVAARLGEDAPTQDEVIQILGQLHMADVMLCEVAPDVGELLRRSQRIASRTSLMKWLSPLAIRIPLLDPDRLLARYFSWLKLVFGPLGALLWIAVVGWGIVTAAQNWSALTSDLGSRVLAPDNLLILLLLFPLIKAAHEFGHACAVKAWGGEVHEMGIMLLVLVPVPYVDASAANAFTQKSRRIIVGAAGMVVELFIASVALFFWLEMQPGVARAALYNVMLIAGVSTIFFNANPLLRFDGYYMLADLIEIPNLRQRSTQYLSIAFQRAVFGAQLTLPDASWGERAWLVFFAIASFVYRLFIMVAIALFLAAEYFIIGVVLAVWALAGAVVLPVLRLFWYVGWNPRLRRRRARAVIATGVIVLALGLLLFVLPMPSWTTAQGVVTVPEQSAVRAGSPGFVTRVLAENGARVRRGERLVETNDPALPARAAMIEGQLAELESRYHKERQDSIARSQGTLEQINVVRAELERTRERLRELTLVSPADGVFTVPVAQDLPGRFLKQGEIAGYVIPDGAMTARVLVPQQSVDLVRSRTSAVTARLAERFSEELRAKILREVPLASDRLPSMALAQAGGGEVSLNPGEENEGRSVQTHFEFEISLDSTRAFGLGERVYVRFDHEDETIAAQVWRAIRQLFLQRLAV